MNSYSENITVKEETSKRTIYLSIFKSAFTTPSVGHYGKLRYFKAPILQSYIKHKYIIIYFI